MWYAIYTKPGREDSVAFLLKNIGIDVLNPKLKSKKYKKNRLIEAVETLFPCYLFAEFNKQQYAHLITYTRGVRYIVGKKDPIRVHEDVIVAIKEGMKENGIIIIKPFRFDRGNRVLIKDGPFKDFYGIFEREIKGPERVMIFLSTLNYRLELDGCFLSAA
jgi:transcription antitermination factor NusG